MNQKVSEVLLRKPGKDFWKVLRIRNSKLRRIDIVNEGINGRERSTK